MKKEGQLKKNLKSLKMITTTKRSRLPIQRVVLKMEAERSLWCIQWRARDRDCHQDRVRLRNSLLISDSMRRRILMIMLGLTMKMTFRVDSTGIQLETHK